MSRGGTSGRSHPRPRERRRASIAERPGLGNRREPIVSGDHSYRLRASELGALEDIGRFRAVTEQDLLRYRYGDDSTKFRQDMRSLSRQGLIERRRFAFGNGGNRTPAVTLTKRGKAVVEQEGSLGNDKPQEYHAGFVKPAELAHDTALYRVYQAESERIRREGGEIERVVLDFELKREIYSALGGKGKSADEHFRAHQQEVADQQGLKVISGKIPLPDVRIEYRNAAGEAARVDLELATVHYKSGQIAAKAQAGFTLYTLGAGGSSGGSPVRDEREITAGILSM